MLINARHAEEVRVAVIEDTRLEAYQVERSDSGLTRGNVYRGVVSNIQPSLNAAFIDFGDERNGFLTVGDVVPEAYHRAPKKGDRAKIENVLERGRPILVQVTKDPVAMKGAALTTNISLAGRYIVLTPFDKSLGVSRKAEDDSQRKAIKARIESLKVPEGCGLIVRTNGLEQTKTTLNRDLAALARLWKQIQNEHGNGRKAALLYSDQDLILESLRDYLDSSVAEVLVDDDAVYEKSQAYMRTFMPRAKTALTRYSERLPIFTRFHLETQIDRIYERSVNLPSGGSISIDATEALTAIDVNSGRSLGATSQAETAFKTNLEAAQEVGRQLRLRDIGGLIVVDFIDMRQRKNERKVENTLRDAMKPDKARVSIGRISPNGLLEVNRQTIKKALQLRTRRPCPTCSGIGSISSPEVMSLTLLRRIEARAASGRLRGVKIHLNPDIADAFQNAHRGELSSLEREFDVRIEIISSPMMPPSEQRVSWIEREGAPRLERPPAILPADFQLTAASEEPDEEEEDEGEDEGETEERKGGRRRRRRRRKSSSSTEPQPDSVEESEQKVEKPTRKRGPRRRSAAVAAGDEAKSTGEDDSAPVRRRTRRRRRPAGETDSSEEVAKTEAPKRRSRRRTRGSSEEGVSDKPAQAEAPKRRSRRRTRSDSEEATVAPAKERESESPTPRRRTRRRTRADSETGSGAERSEPQSEAATADRRPRRRRRTRVRSEEPAAAPSDD